MSNSADRPAIAIIGMACRLPGAASIEAFWTALRSGREGVSFFSAEELLASGVSRATLEDPAYVRAGTVVDGVELFDAELFGVGVREAELMDPQHRLFLECAWEALESAGCDPARFPEGIGVYAGAGHNYYLINNLLARPDLLGGLDGFQVAIGSDNDYLATRVSYKLDLRGPGVTVQTASSTSLVAVHLACRALQSGDCDIALAGGVAVKLPQVAGYKAGGARSPDGHTRTFDAGANGTVFGSGAGVVVLKPLARALEDGDHVHAVIRGSAVNNDGARKRGYTAPSSEGIAAVVARALAEAEVHPDTVGLVEAHGTGTALGDPMEVAALTAAFRRQTERRGFCALGSVKSGIGHPSQAAGVAGLIAAVLALEHGEIPPAVNFERPNPAIDFAGSPFYVATELREWRATGATPRRAGVSALGFGGTNAHVVLEEAPALPAASPGRQYQLVTLSARTPAARAVQAERLARALRSRPELPLADVAHTLHVGRRQMRSRMAVVCSSTGDAAAALESLDPRRIMTGTTDRKERPVAFMFPGHGSQHLNMTRGLYEGEPFFRETVDACAERLAPLLGCDLRRILYPAPGEEAAAASMLAETRYIQPALFTVEYALGGLWMRWGLRPDGMIGYSIGEYAAACLAGIFDLSDALAVVVARADLAQQLPEGAMLAAALSEAELEPLLGSGLSLAAVSAPAHCIVAGIPGRIDALRKELASRGVACKRLTLSRAFHSEMMDPLLDQYREVIRGVRLHPPGLGLVSGVTGTWLRPEEATDPEHWVRELRGTVRFSQGIAVLAGDPRRVFLEVGPSNLLGALVRGHSGVAGNHVVVSSCRAPAEVVADSSALLAAAGKLWLAGCPIDWTGFYAGQRRRRVPLPTYPFERQRYWIEPAAPSAESPAELHPAAPILSASPQAAAARPAAEAAAPSAPISGRPRPPLATPYLAPVSPVEQRVATIWQELLGIGDVGLHDRLFELGGDSLVAVQLVSRVRDALRVEVPLAAFLETPTVHGLALVVTGGLARQNGRTGLGEAPRLGQDPALQDARRCEPRMLPAAPPAARPKPAGGPVFSLFFFSGDESAFGEDRYRLVLEGAKFADAHGFTAVWTPERHFDKFGGLYPNPAVLGAALAQATSRIQIRAGSVVAPLHHPLRIAEEWAVVDNLSHGRVGLSFAAGFHPHDFALAPEAFADRKDLMLQGIETFRRLWRGEPVRLEAGHGRETEIRVYPRPVQVEPPIWVAATSTPQTFVDAGRLGLNVLTALLRFTMDELAQRIAEYRESRREHGHDPAAGIVTVMLHTFVGPDLETVRAATAEPLREYLRSHLDFVAPMAAAAGPAERPAFSDADREALLANAFERYSTSRALIGTPDTCLEMVRRLATVGVDEIACLVDFGLSPDTAMDGLHHLNELRRLTAAPLSQAPQVAVQA